MTDSKIVHDTISVSRRLDASPERVFAAWTDPAARRKWEPTPIGFETIYQGHDFTIDGIENSEMRKDGQTLATFQTRFVDIVPNQRIISTVRVMSNGQVMSSSQHTIHLIADGKGTHLHCTEQVAWLMGKSLRAEHEGGWKTLLDRLQAVVEA